MSSTRWGIATLAALAGCYDLRGGQPDSAASVDLGPAVDIAVQDVVDIAVLDDVTDAAIADLVDAAVGPDDANASRTFDAFDASLDPDVVDAAGASDIVDVPVDMGPPPCPSGQTRCGDACVDTAIAPAHCGACGASCPTRDNAAPTIPVQGCLRRHRLVVDGASPRSLAVRDVGDEVLATHWIVLDRRSLTNFCARWNAAAAGLPMGFSAAAFRAGSMAPIAAMFDAVGTWAREVVDAVGRAPNSALVSEFLDASGSMRNAVRREIFRGVA